MEDQNEQIDVVQTLQHVLDIVCIHLQRRDLKNLSEVCQQWRPTVLNEIKKKCCILQLDFSHKTNNRAGIADDIRSASMLIYNTHFYGKTFSPPPVYLSREISNELRNKMLQHVNNQLPKVRIVLEVENLLTSDDQQFQDAKQQGNLNRVKDDHDIFGLLIPSIQKRIQVHVTSILPTRCPQGGLGILFDRELSKLLSEELGYEGDDSPPSALIMFTNKVDGPALMNEFCKSANQFDNNGNTKYVCIFETGDEFSPQNHTVLLRFSGESVECHSALIRLYTQRDSIESALVSMKEKIKPNRHYIGFVYSLNCVRSECDHLQHPNCDSHAMMRTLKRIFPFVRFVSFFENYYVRGCFVMPGIKRRMADSQLERWDNTIGDKLFFHTTVAIISWE